MENHTTNKTKSSPNPRENASLLSRFTLFYIIPTFIYGYRKNITEEDIYEPTSAIKSSNLGKKAIGLWEKELNVGCKPSLGKLLVKLLLWDYLLVGVGMVICELVARPLQAFYFGELMSSQTDGGVERTPYVYAVGIIICVFVSDVVIHPTVVASYHLAYKVRVICGSLVYWKCLKLSKDALSQVTTGQIINLISNDVNIFERSMFTSQYLWVGPLQMVIILGLMYREIGVASVYGVGLSVFTVPLYFISAKLASKYRLKTSITRDNRLRLINEVIQGINVIKMYAWEKSFRNTTSTIRNHEINTTKLGLYVKAVTTAYDVFSAVALFATITAMVVCNGSLNARSTFMTITFFQILCFTLNYALPFGMIVSNEIIVAVRRINEFLMRDEARMVLSAGTDGGIIIQNGGSVNLSSLSFELQPVSLNAVIGSVGSGKTSLLHLLLGEIPLTTGSVQMNGSVSYASQEPWIFPSTVRQNILFGSVMDESRYNNVIRCCALERDLSLLPYGDKTTVGERGESLSGGQKARINLARAIYREADVYLLDDPLSSVDTRVGKQIFEQCIQGFLQGKTVVLVTHQLQYLKYVDFVLALDNGTLVAKGSRTDLETSGFDFAKFLQKNEEDLVDSVADEQSETVYTEKTIPETKETYTGTKLITLRTYKDYLYASKSCTHLVATGVFFILVQMAMSGSHYFLAYWVNKEHLVDLREQRDHLIYIYCALTLACIIFTTLRTISFISLAMASSKILHDGMFQDVIQATIRYFCSHSSGSILNRFSKDLATIDEVLPHAIMIALRTALSILGVLVIICFVNPWFLIPSFVMMLTLNQLRKFYLATNIHILRTEGKVRGPLYAHVNASLQGLATIRAFGMQEKLVEEFDRRQDINTGALDMASTTSRAFASWLDLLSVTFISIVTIYYTLNADSYGGKVGLVISQAMQLLGQLPWGVRQATDTESYMVSVERVLECNSIEKERTSGQKAPDSWPTYGEIKFKNVHLKYSTTLPYVLKDLNFTINPMEKIGIVGRTGAGKSSIVSALFQLVEVEGSILIDEVDINSINLHDLRTQISIIPQDPVLFSGSIRRNLDPFDEYNDEVLWRALDEVRLKDVVNRLQSGLSFEISQDGSSFSVGQRQLICLARAIIRNNKILVLDEATANVDMETDGIIQETIRRKFAKCTVLTVAHRLNTIIDSDRVMVMESGIAVEFDHPYNLLQNINGVFYNLVQQTEKLMANTLIEIARENYEAIHGRN